MPLYTLEDLNKWKDDFEQNSTSTFRKTAPYPNVGQKVLFKGRYHFHHKGGKNQHIPEFPASVSLKWIHNHDICTASALRYRDVGPAAEEKLIGFFNDGLSPSSALDALHKSIEDDPNYVTMMADRQIVPHYFFVNSVGGRALRHSPELAPLRADLAAPLHQPQKSASHNRELAPLCTSLTISENIDYKVE
ncbi:hypothetical protein EGW08_011975 [Elysia chlorotica]|uniref:Uncharacterized protein n=1 Tax=Elysia chlorotica TaxID=188477 RepID=A0A433TFC0_ELYCH|nr:hypothetical protein EGW08_011975 [Elysia chlorotica]